MKNFKSVENFNMNKFGFKTAETKKFVVVDYEEDAEKFIEADANQYKKDFEDDDELGCEVELLALPNDTYVAVGTTSFCKFWKIVEVFDIKHE